MENLVVRKEDGRFFEIKLFEPAKITGVKIQKLMIRHQELSKKHWVGIVAILSSINGYSEGKMDKICEMCELLGIKPLSQASNWHFFLQTARISPIDFKIYKQDVVHSNGMRFKRKGNSLFLG